MRDTAIGGLTDLLRRGDWQDSAARSAIASMVGDGLSDPDPLVRLRASEGVPSLFPDMSPMQLVGAIGDLMRGEKDEHVLLILLSQLTPLASRVPADVDAVLQDLPLTAASDNQELTRYAQSLLTYLALVHEMPGAVAAVHDACRDAPKSAGLTAVFVQQSRDYLASDDREVRLRAFDVVALAADASLARWSEDPSEHVKTDLPEDQLAELRGAATVAHEVAQQLYFASGAFRNAGEHDPKVLPEPDTFAELAFPVLMTCARLQVAQCVHPAVETMIHLAPLNESRALKSIAAAVPPDASYAGDSLAGAAVIPYLQRLLTEQRQLVLYDEAGLAAFLHLLTTFAAAGDTTALAMAYDFADVFR